ncbi:right-handed parallel beta-helix repeat-containing protein [Streptomyces europaeiscabiei]|uniref:Right-handed parallel beta-helix repeat-containing protein n=1 Tax=Streptomyces europaeiscabiei TaxID=146819 RepID=A0ABU4NQ42_9ACTN|nr:right-handed parallel beta-helix repeat-containing protein [Streptomyces europaeiscabiei]MDX3555176.1 right-handed parallel beta-helix repeat-containing protein [Streptomyces europaeiscabiei]MDX3705190.1 right-handed parallel beta-helix repeat-containing protein [Streptomyces europaeiscabiei]MDX3864399.1 right-handed parallel beta-helix repeat-containing protein [Streptomyces europaeiscabiei]MDX3871519.1 right-handed parallel beta-helix repeat-containing protein [Streptomyces europaeiscabiei
MTQYTYGGSPADVLTDTAGNVVADFQVLVYRAGTNELVTALYEVDGTTPISELRSNDDGSDTPGAIRSFKADDVTAIDYVYNGPGGSPVRWYQAARELAQEAASAAADALSKTDGGTVQGPTTFEAGLDVEDGLNVTGGATVDGLDVEGDLSVSGTFTPENLQLSGMRIFNPKVYGALGNGTGNDAPFINDALTAANAAGGGWVIVPSGTYMIGEILRIYRNTRLTLLPGAEFRRNYAGTMLLNGDSDQAFGGYTGHGNILIEGGLWNMRGTTGGLTGSAMCISIGHARGVTISDVVIQDVSGYHAIELNSTKNATIERCRFLGYVDPGGRDFSEAVQVDLAKSSGVFGGFGPYDNTVCEDVTIRDCYVGASGTAGTTAWPRGVGSHSATVDVAHRRIKILDNSFEGCLQYGVVAYAYNDSTIADNTMKGCGAGIRCRSIISADAADSTNTSGVVTNASQVMENLTIDNNTIVDSTGYDDPILLFGEATGRITGVTITGNTVDGADDGENGIRLYYVSDYTVTGSTVRNTGGTGISQEQVIGGVVGPNRVYAPGGSGISCDTGTGITIAVNQIRDAGVNGVHVIGGSDIQVQTNYIKGASRAAAGSWGIRCSTSADGLLITGNKIRKYGSGNEVAAGIGITSTCTNVKRHGNDLGDTGLDDQSTGAEPSPFDAAGALEVLVRPSGRYETTSRLRAGTTSTPTSGTLYLVPVWLPQGLAVSNISFVSGGTAMVTPTNWWFTLHNRSRVALARTADQLTAAWAANTVKTVAIAQATAGAASSYTTTYGGLHYLGVMIKATTVPSLVSEGSVADVLASVAPGFGGTDTGQTTPPTVTAGAFTAGAFGAGSGILVHGYTT